MGWVVIIFVVGLLREVVRERWAVMPPWSSLNFVHAQYRTVQHSQWTYDTTPPYPAILANARFRIGWMG